MTIKVVVGRSQKKVIIGGPSVVFQPLDYRQGIVDITSGESDVNFLFSTPFTANPVFNGNLVYNGISGDDGYGHKVYNLTRTGCYISFSDNIHTTGYQFHYNITAS